MLRVPTYVVPSAIEGFGPFAAEPVPAGSGVREYTHGVDLIIRQTHVLSLPDALRSCFFRYDCFDGPGEYVPCGFSRTEPR